MNIILESLIKVNESVKTKDEKEGCQVERETEHCSEKV